MNAIEAGRAGAAKTEPQLMTSSVPDHRPVAPKVVNALAMNPGYSVGSGQEQIALKVVILAYNRDDMVMTYKLGRRLQSL